MKAAALKTGRGNYKDFRQRAEGYDLTLLKPNWQNKPG
jgi:hypothetical protein